ncbi:MAG: hypothetical protein A2Y15_03595 [Clostridiales bacterium GWF2_36_10]|nr:MAG: hypothetical protein A2Y15_03595 [Clostridiales bacterium GWF2_36_10]HAN20291.1 SAM-dependent methyltransferase [Clostridiales bacterium]
MKQTQINRKLNLEEPEGGIYFGTDVLLLAHFMGGFKSGVGVDLGTGSGIIPLLLLSSGIKVKITGIEIQKNYCDIANQNSGANGFSDKFSVLLGDIKEIKTLFPSGGADAVFTNPPYLKTTSGRHNVAEHKNIAFHEVFCDINDICRAASWCLKSGGKFYAVYRPERAVGFLTALRNNRLEPKKITFVYPSAEKAPSLFLVEAKKDAKEGLLISKNLYIYTDTSNSIYTDEMKKIYSEFE